MQLLIEVTFAHDTFLNPMIKMSAVSLSQREKTIDTLCILKFVVLVSKEVSMEVLFPLESV